MLSRKIIASALLLLSQLTQAQTCPDEQEFAWLAEHGIYENFLEHHTYAEVKDTNFIALQAASNDDRTCVYGFNQSHVPKGRDVRIKTSFWCFDTGAYTLVPLQEYDPGSDGSRKPPIDGMSIGIGNIHVVEFPTDIPLIQPNIPLALPHRVTINIEQPRFSKPEIVPFDPTQR